MMQILAESDNGTGDNGDNWPFLLLSSQTSDDVDGNGDDDNYDYDYDDEPLWLLSK